ncbi:MAG: sigma-70 family RNA polymerase sigma factor [Bacteroides sp.]|nr:sigma-70 family RNA polymerase sigma factor [Bacteroides sp.]MBD5354774.1 sigma-70 family RNA polymerase sigma factor [Bacteroides sp.]
MLNVNTDILTSTFITLRAKLRSIAGGIAGADEADDVIHDAFCRLWARHQAVGSETDAARLTYTAVRNSAIDSYRRRHANPSQSLDDAPGTLTVVATDDDSERRDREDTYATVISIARRVLNSRQFDVFDLHDIRGMDYEEVAATLGMTQENVRVTLSRARKTIREIYRNNYLK